jgi:hypothetical protein
MGDSTIVALDTLRLGCLLGHFGEPTQHVAIGMVPRSSALPLWPATAPKWFRWGLVGSRHDEELDDLGIERIRQLLEDGNRRVFQPTFEAAYIGSIDTGVSGKSLLGEVALDSKSPEIPRHKCLRSHVERRALRSSLNHGL